METNFFVIGENRRTAFFLRNIKFFLISLLVIIISLSLTVAYLYYKNILDREQYVSKIKNEKTRSENLIKKFRIYFFN